MAVPTLAEFERLGRRDQRKPCKVAVAVESLSAKEREVVLQAIVSDLDDVRRGALAWLRAEPRNIELTTGSISAHKTGRCKCQPLT